MKNQDRYKTAQERAEACKEFMKDHKEYDEMPYIDAAFSWLDLEAEEEKPETIEDIVAELRKEPLAEGGAKPWLHYLADRIESANNRVAKAVKESEVK